MPADSWLLSEDRRAFDALMLRDPMQAAEDYFKKRENEYKILNNIIDGKAATIGAIIDFARKIMSEEDQYKIAAMAPVVAVKAKMAELQGDLTVENKAKEHLANFAKANIFKEAVAERQEFYNHIFDAETVIKKDAKIIANKVKTVAKNIEQHIPGGLSAVGAAMAQAPEVIKEALEGKMEQVQAKLEQAERMNRAAAEREIQREAERARVAAEREVRDKKLVEELRKAMQSQETAQETKAVQPELRAERIVEKVDVKEEARDDRTEKVNAVDTEGLFGDDDAPSPSRNGTEASKSTSEKMRDRFEVDPNPVVDVNNFPVVKKESGNGKAL